MKPKASLRSFLALSGSALLAVSSVNANQFWDGGGGDDNWNTPANWGENTLPAFGTTTINFGGTNAGGTAVGNVSALQTTADNDLTAGSLIYNIAFTNNGTSGRTQAFTLQGNSILLGNATNSGITTTAVTSGPVIEDVISLNIDLNAPLSNPEQNRQFTTGVNHNLKIDGVISGGTRSVLLARVTGSKLTLTNANNSYLGATNIAEGTSSTLGALLEITSIANGGSNSSIGASSNAAGNLRFGAGFNDGSMNTLRYIGDADAETDRLFTLYGNFTGTNSAIESSGDGTLSFTNTGAIASGHPKARNFYLGGTNTGDNTFAPSLSNFTEVSTFTKQGIGKWIVSGTHTYTGATTIPEGTLQFAKQVSLYNNNTAGTGWTAANIKVASAATLALNVGGAGEFDTANVTTLLTNLGGANGTSTTGFAAGSRIGFDTTNAGGSFTVADAITNSTGAGGGAIGLTKLGTGTLELTNANTYSGTTKILGGILQLNNGLALQNSALDATNSVTGNSFQGLKTTVTTLTLGGLNGTKDLSSLFTSTSGGYNGLTGLTLNPGAGSTHSYSGDIGDGAGAMTLTKTGDGTQVLSGANSYSGSTTISAGVLQIGDGSNTGSLSASSAITNNATLAFNRSDTITQGTGFGTITSGSGALVQNGSGTLILNAANTYSGGTMVTAGTLQLLNNSAAGGGTITVSGSAATLLIGSNASPGITIANDVTVTNATAIVQRTVAASNGSNTDDYTTGTSGNLKSDLGGTDTTAQLLGGTNSSASETILNMSFSASSAADNDGIRRSDVFNISGAANDAYVIQILVDAGLASDSRVGWLDTVNNVWVNVGSNLISGAYNGSLTLGNYGFNPDAGGTGIGGVWAVVNYGGSYSAIPEPTTALAGLLLAAGLLRRRRTA
jgi:fibronectin-binding autotransporter adhesin